MDRIMYNKPKFSQLIGLLFLNTILVACGGGAGSRLDGTTGNNNGGGNVGAGEITLDCAALDPTKVYMIGYLAPNAHETSVIVSLDGSYPPRFCPGLSGVETGRVTITDGGYPIIPSPDGQSIDKLVADPLFKKENPGGNPRYIWEYPTDLRANDEAIAPMQTAPNNFYLKHDGSADEIYYAVHRGPVYSTKSSTSVYYANPNKLLLLGVMPNGMLLMYSDPIPEDNLDSMLYVVDTDLNEIVLTSPDNERRTFEHTARAFLNTTNGHQSAWIIATDNEFRNERRWSIDLESLIVTDDGAFAVAPDYVDLRTPIGEGTGPIKGRYKKLDGNGNLVQLAYYNSPPPGSDKDITQPNYESLIIQRPLESSGAGSTILYSDAIYDGDFNWRHESSPIPHIYSGFVITGQ